MADVHEILSQRGKTHGDFADVAKVEQGLKEVLRSGKNWGSLSASHRTALEMIAHKMGRILAGDPDVLDHWDDMAGYSTLGRKDAVSRTKVPSLSPEYRSQGTPVLTPRSE
jgi:hypothetical protein